MNGTHQCLVFAEDVNLLDKNLNTMKINTEAQLDSTKQSQ
jgi:hypothetical protein